MMLVPYYTAKNGASFGRTCRDRAHGSAPYAYALQILRGPQYGDFLHKRYSALP